MCHVTLQFHVVAATLQIVNVGEESEQKTRAMLCSSAPKTLQIE